MALWNRAQQPQAVRDAAYIKQQVEKGVRFTAKQTASYWLVRAFLSNEQWVWWNSVSNQLDDVTLTGMEHTRVEANKMLPAKRQIEARLTSRPLVNALTVPPRAFDEANIQAAKTCEVAVRDLAHREQWEDVVRPEFVSALLDGGTSALCIEWDPFAGGEMTDAEGQPVIDPVTGRKVGRGDVRTTVCSVAEIVTAPGVTNIERALWWARVSHMTPDEAQDLYRLPEKPRANAGLVLSPAQRRVMFPGQQDGSQALAEMVTVLSYYERPNVGNPQGQVSVVIGDKLVQSGPWYFPFTDRLNISPATEIIIKGQWMGDSALRSAIVPQMALNAVTSAIVEHAKTVGAAKMTAQAHSLDMNTQQDDDLPGDIIYYAPGSERPGWLAPAPVSPFFAELPPLLSSIIDELLNTQPVTRGDLPPNVEAAQAIAMLSEYADTPLGPVARRIAAAFTAHATKAAKLYEAFVTDTRVAAVRPNDSMPYRTSYWSGAAFLGNTEVTIPSDAVEPRSRASQEAFAFRVANQFGLDIRQFSKVAGLAGDDDIVKAIDKDLDRARHENYLMTLGQEILPAVFDNDATHLAEHDNFRKTDEYANLPPEIRQIIDFHCAAHEQFAMKKLADTLALVSQNPLLATLPRSASPQFVPPQLLLSFVQMQQQQMLLAQAQQDGTVPNNEGGASAPTGGS